MRVGVGVGASLAFARTFVCRATDGHQGIVGRFSDVCRFDLCKHSHVLAESLGHLTHVHCSLLRCQTRPPRVPRRVRKGECDIGQLRVERARVCECVCVCECA